MPPKALLITGATGHQGGAVIQALLTHAPNAFTILAVTRDANSPSAQRLAQKSPSIKLVQGNLDDVGALFRSARKTHPEPVWGVYSVQISIGTGVTLAGEIAQGKALIDESVKEGVRHFVYGSVERGGDEKSWDNPTPIPHFQSKYHIERHLRDVTGPGNEGEGMGWTVLRPVAFMGNLTPGFPTKVFMAALRNHLGDKPLQWVAPSDIGVFAMKAFTEPETWNRRAVGLAGDELSWQAMNEAFANATGEPVPVTYWFFGSVLTYLAKELALMIGWFASDGYKADVAARRKEHPEMLTMEKWLVKESQFDTTHKS
ncbi:NAD(P)-binding protein [Annulohypoxylon maeteangense]|uniref:NAD(P)-binding protein n=1 Tax=Annulohypoxylon maeteangense TaxID=1927788 RepID=UPI0020086C80|nr:NAD(P)-binding protein [Annulohypoxylon maeteangense]KAI0880749.1 NAD(P)-binding protein [Annulohypoxylon maeteangense]